MDSLLFGFTDEALFAELLFLPIVMLNSLVLDRIGDKMLYFRSGLLDGLSDTTLELQQCLLELLSAVLSARPGDLSPRGLLNF